MPYRTKYGKHYHMTQGCHGADIACGTEGLSPCSDCCGGGAGGGSAAGGGIGAVGGPGVGAAGAGDFAQAESEAEGAGEDTSPSPAVATTMMEAGTRGFDGQDLPDNDIAAGEFAQAMEIEQTRVTLMEEGGVPHDKWPPEARAAAGQATASLSRYLGKVGSLTVFSAPNVTTSNPFDPTDSRGNWLYDVSYARIIAPDGTDVGAAMRRARDGKAKAEAERRKFDIECFRKADEIVARHEREVYEDCVDECVADARRDWEENVLGPWEDGYRKWRVENEDRAQSLAERLRLARPESRHPYIEADVELEMLNAYKGEHPHPGGWRWDSHFDPYVRAKREAERRSKQRLEEEGWDRDAALERSLGLIRGERDRNGSGGVSDKTLRETREAEEVISRYPDAGRLADVPLVWENGRDEKIPPGLVEAILQDMASRR